MGNSKSNNTIERDVQLTKLKHQRIFIMIKPDNEYIREHIIKIDNKFKINNECKKIKSIDVEFNFYSKSLFERLDNNQDNILLYCRIIKMQTFIIENKNKLIDCNEYQHYKNLIEKLGLLDAIYQYNVDCKISSS